MIVRVRTSIWSSYLFPTISYGSCQTNSNSMSHPSTTEEILISYRTYSRKHSYVVYHDSENLFLYRIGRCSDHCPLRSECSQETRGIPKFRICTKDSREQRYSSCYEGVASTTIYLKFWNKKLIQKQSDHPVLNSRYLLFEAQQAHYYGLSTELSLASITTTPAKAAGLSHRVGFLSKGEVVIAAPDVWLYFLTNLRLRCR